MAKTVGVPQALLFYKYYPMWKAYFEAIGFDVVVSAPTNKAVVRAGTSLGENELCLPVKIFFGHVAALDGRVDLIFVPRVVSVDPREYTCPKFLGLPDMARALGFETPILGPTFNLRDGRLAFARQAFSVARDMGASRIAAVRAVLAGLAAHRRWQEHALDGRMLRLPEAVPDSPAKGLRIAVAGHPYNIYDPHISLDLIRRLAEKGVEVVLPEMVHEDQIDRAVEELPKALFWTFEKEVVGSVRHWARAGEVDGIVYLLSFACGPDSLVQVLVEDAAKNAGDRETPLMSLVIDEHSGEAGFITRLEAFLDMLVRRRAIA